MSKIKISTNLFLGKLELSRFQDFLDKDGFRKLVQLISKPGLIKLESELDWLNGKVEQGIDTQQGKKVIKVSTVELVDKDGLYVSSRNETSLTVPSSNTWYWVSINHRYSNDEKGTFSIDSQGNLVGINSELKTILRQLPNFPSKVKFSNSIHNTQEYEVLEVINDTSAVLNGFGWIPESNLKLQLVGTYTPGIVIPEIDKYPFNFDSYELNLIEEEELNTEPTHEIGKVFFLSRVKVLDGQLIIQDKRVEIFSLDLGSKLLLPNKDSNPLIGVESVKYTDTNGNNENNLIELSWCFRSTNWSVNSSNNILTLYGSSLGGLYKSVTDFVDGDFNGWRVYTEDGEYSKVMSSVKTGTAINLLLDTLDINRFSKNGGLTNIEQQIVITPPSDYIEIELTNTISENVYYKQLFPINTPIAKIEALVYEYPTCKYIVKYRYVHNSEYTNWQLIPSDQKYGYYTETSFTPTGQLKENGLVRKKYKSSETEGFIEFNAYLNNLYYIKNRLDVNIEEVSKLVFSTDNSSISLVPKTNTMYQLIDNETFSNNSSIEGFFVNLSKDTSFVRNSSRFVFLISKELSLGFKTITITQDFESDSNPGSVLKVINSRDAQLAKFNQSILYVEVVFDGVGWILLQNYELGSLGELKIFQGEVGDYFDNSGLGKSGGWVGFAICNGSNSTSNLTELFQLEEGSTTNYKFLYAKRIF